MNRTELDSFRWYCMPSAIYLTIISALGILGHLKLVWVTYKSKSLRSACCILIAILAFMDAGHQLNAFVYAAYIFSGEVINSQRNCFWMNLFPAFTMLHSIMMCLTIGMDRLLCVVAPIDYNRISKGIRYILLQNTTSFAYATWICTVSYLRMKDDPDSEVLCLVTAVFVGDAMTMYMHSALAIYILLIICYAIVWILLYKKKTQSKISLNMKPITITILLVLFGWLTTILTIHIWQQISTSEIMFISLTTYSGCFVNTAISCNYLVYRYFSTDYRHAIQDYPMFFGKKLVHKSSLITVSATQTRSFKSY